MIPVTEKFNTAIKQKSRQIFWTGKILLKDETVVEFDDKHILLDSGSITHSCSGTNELEFGTVYASEMGITLKLDKLTTASLENGIVHLFFNIKLNNDSIETIPMGIFEIAEANRTKHFVQLKGYDYMVRFDKTLNFSDTYGSIFELLEFCCKKCHVELGMSKEMVEILPNGKEQVGVYSEHDIESFRDLLHYIGMTTSTFATIGRDGKLYLKRYLQDSVWDIREENRYELSISDFKVDYTAIQSTNLKTKISEYYALEVDTGLTMNVGVNPLMQLGLPDKRTRMCQAILQEVTKIKYTPLDSLVVSNPALEVGDLITFYVLNQQYLSIITSIEYTIHGKYRIKSVGKNTLKSANKSKQDKNIQGILQSIESDKLAVNTYTNLSAIKIKQKNQTIIDFEFASNKETDAFFMATILFSQKSKTIKVEEKLEMLDGEERKEITIFRTSVKKQRLHLKYYLNEFPIEQVQPSTECGEGENLITVMYPLKHLPEKVINHFVVEMSVDDGEIDIPIEGIQAIVVGSGLGGSVPWDGKIKVNETIPLRNLTLKSTVSFKDSSVELKVDDFSEYKVTDVLRLNSLKLTMMNFDYEEKEVEINAER